jgi:hypothetical protein
MITCTPLGLSGIFYNIRAESLKNEIDLLTIAIPIELKTIISNWI